MNVSVKVPLGIEGIGIEETEENEFGDMLIRVSSLSEGALCRECGKLTTNTYCCGRDIYLRHLPVFGHRSFIIIRPKRYQCLHCAGRPTVTQELPWYSQKSPHTLPYENHILLSPVSSTVSDVCMKEDIGYDAVKGIIDRHVGNSINRNEINFIETVGIDEISLKKGHRDFVTVVTSLSADGTEILSVLRNREKVTVKDFFNKIPEKLKNTVRTVCCDMYDGYINAAKEVFGKDVIITVDRFHVAKLYRKCVDDLRKQEMKRLKNELPDDEYEKMKGAMWAFRKRDADLTLQEREILRTVFKHSEILETVYEFADDLTYISDRKISKKHATAEIRVWKELTEIYDLKCFEKFNKTLEKYEDEITNYFIERKTSGFVEGLNNKIKVIKRRCYGIFNIRHLFQRIYIDLNGYTRFA